VRGLSICVMMLFLLCGHARAEPACIDPTTLAHSTVSITRYFNDQERTAEPGVFGIRGTAWFLSPTLIVTAGHVAESMRLSGQDWTQLEILDGEDKQSTSARIVQLAGSYSETLAVLELRTAFSHAQDLRIRTEPLVPEEHVVSLAYPANRLRFADGRFVQYGHDDRVAGMALLEMYDGNDRLVLDHGASGAPVVDCKGRVVAAVSSVFTTTMEFPSRAIRVSTAWGTPNVVSVPIQVLRDFVSAE